MRTPDDRGRERAVGGVMLNGLQVCVLDVETTGLGDDAEIVEIAVAEVILGRSAPRMMLHERVRPSFPIPPASTAIHGISDADVADCDTWDQLAEVVELAIRDRVCCAYNVPFDARRKQLVPIVPPPEQWIDAAVLCSAMQGARRGRHPRSLLANALIRGIDHDAHSAAADTMATAILLPRVLAELVAWDLLPAGARLDDLLQLQKRTALEDELWGWHNYMGHRSHPWHDIHGEELPKPCPRWLPMSGTVCPGCGFDASIHIDGNGIARTDHACEGSRRVLLGVA